MAMMEGQQESFLSASIAEPHTENGRPRRVVVKKAHAIISAHIVAEAVSKLHVLDLRWSENSSGDASADMPKLARDGSREKKLITYGNLESHKESKVILAPETWLDLRIKGSQLSRYLRRKCNRSPKGLYSYPIEVNGARNSLHWILEARKCSWHVLLDATGILVGKDQLNLGYFWADFWADFVLCSLDNAHVQCQPSNITCLLVRKKSFNIAVAAAPLEYA
ncbi:hypothetical protein GH714_000622 [Hevea brasiliensis]|uniref:Uncharacterized protein n=1 Tax=Hevea brasiliensis TaxID=3981 RepID=A0A6A6LRI0_HEVBR|nr:hypothetical protein GH714_000622 [Hevea brasiliensis]